MWKHVCPHIFVLIILEFSFIPSLWSTKINYLLVPFLETETHTNKSTNIYNVNNDVAFLHNAYAVCCVATKTCLKNIFIYFASLSPFLSAAKEKREKRKKIQTDILCWGTSSKNYSSVKWRQNGRMYMIAIIIKCFEMNIWRMLYMNELYKLFSLMQTIKLNKDKWVVCNYLIVKPDCQEKPTPELPENSFMPCLAYPNSWKHILIIITVKWTWINQITTSIKEKYFKGDFSKVNSHNTPVTIYFYIYNKLIFHR